jgi:regulator of replication initiation timing
MNQISKHSEVTEVAIPESKNEFTEGKSTRKPLREWGFEVAGLNRGEATALESHLRWIEQGHIVDETYNAEDELTQKNKVAEEISRKEREQNDIDKDKQHITEVVIPDKENQIASHQLQIETKKIQLAEGKINSNFSGMRFGLYASLCTLISFYLIFFYASVIHASFFRSMLQMVNSANNDDVTLMLNSIFDTKGIFQWNTQLIFTYFGAFIFFGFGILPHIFASEGSKFKMLKVISAIIICLIIDSLLAYKIDSGIHELKTMVGIADAEWLWYKSINFYLVLAFGFGTYLLWGILYEAALTEHEKKNINARVEIEIISLKDKIRELQKEIISQKEVVKEMQKQIDALKLEIEKLRKQMEQSSLKPEELKRNMEHFYAGWLAYLHGISEQNTKLIPCEMVYRKFQAKINDPNSQLN